MLEISGKWIKPALAVFAGIAARLFGGWDMLLQVLLILVVCDYTSGCIRAARQGKLSSSAGFRGLLKKGAIFLVVVVAAQLDRLGGIQNDLFRSGAALFYIANEGLSILENLGGIGVNLPNFLRKALLELRDSKERTDHESDTNRA